MPSQLLSQDNLEAQDDRKQRSTQIAGNEEYLKYTLLRTLTINIGCPML